MLFENYAKYIHIFCSFIYYCQNSHIINCHSTFVTIKLFTLVRLYSGKFKYLQCFDSVIFINTSNIVLN